MQGPAGLDEGTPGGDTRGPRHLAGTEGRRPETAIAPPIPRTDRGQNADRATDQIKARGLPSCYRASTDKEDEGEVMDSDTGRAFREDGDGSARQCEEKA